MGLLGGLHLRALLALRPRVHTFVARRGVPALLATSTSKKSERQPAPPGGAVQVLLEDDEIDVLVEEALGGNPVYGDDYAESHRLPLPSFPRLGGQ